MSKQWFYQVMGTTIGPVSSAELKDRCHHGQIQPDTLVRLGADGQWHPADHVKGLMDTAPVAAAAPVAAPVPVAAQKVRAEPSHALPVSRGGVLVSERPSGEHTPEQTYHLPGEAETAEPEDDQPTEYDFFRLVGFEQAIGTTLHQVLHDHCRRNGLTFTQATRRALAEFLGRKDLLGDPPAAQPTASENAARTVAVLPS